MDLTLKIDVVQNISKEDFEKKYLKTQTPVLIKNLCKDTDAAKKWNFDYFKTTAGDVIMDLYDSRNTNDSSAFTTPDVKMRFSDYLEILSHNEKTSLRVFLFDLFKVKPSLRKDFPCPEMFKGILGKIGFMFFGGKDTKVRMHQDIDMSNVLLTQFEGKKRVVLFSPKYSELLYKLPLNTYTLINPDEPDYEKFPALKYVKGYDIIMEAGDSLYMPSGYWHYITYLEGGFAVSYRKMAQSLDLLMNGVLSLVLYLPFDKMMNRLAGDSWMKYKIKTAHKKATYAMESYNISQNTGAEVISMSSEKSEPRFRMSRFF